MPYNEEVAERLFMGTMNLLKHFNFVGRSEKLEDFAQAIYTTVGLHLTVPTAISSMAVPVDRLRALHMLNAVDMAVYQSFCAATAPAYMKQPARASKARW